MLGGAGDQRSTAMSKQSNPTVATMGIDIGKNSFHVVGLDRRGAIVLRQKWSRGQVEARLRLCGCYSPAVLQAALAWSWHRRRLPGVPIAAVGNRAAQNVFTASVTAAPMSAWWSA